MQRRKTGTDIALKYPEALFSCSRFLLTPLYLVQYLTWDTQGE